jgi:RNA polymerase sigma factor, sigma-70 family/RNA polymerase sigma factor, TIGR02999 family
MDKPVAKAGATGERGSAPGGQEVTRLLRAWSAGDSQALDKLTPLVYQELHRRAHWHMARERAGQTLQTTALVNEAYVRLIDLRDVSWRDRAHFFALSSRLIRRVLIDAARARASLKRGGGASEITLDETFVVSNEPRADLLALDDALSALAAVDQRKGQVVELRFFGGLTVDETADVLHVSAETVKRDWSLAKAWLRRELKSNR